MKKTALVLATILSSSMIYAAPNNTAIIYDTNHSLETHVNYEVCFRDATKGSSDCSPEIHKATIKKNQDYVAINLTDSSTYVKVINAFALDDNKQIKSHGEFPGEEDCKVFQYSTATLEDMGDGTMNCLRAS